MFSYPVYELSKIVYRLLNGPGDFIGRCQGNTGDNKRDPIALSESNKSRGAVDVDVDVGVGSGLDEFRSTGCHPTKEHQGQFADQSLSVKDPGFFGMVVIVVVVVRVRVGVAVGMPHVVQSRR